MDEAGLFEHPEPPRHNGRKKYCGYPWDLDAETPDEAAGCVKAPMTGQGRAIPLTEPPASILRSHRGLGEGFAGNVGLKHKGET